MPTTPSSRQPNILLLMTDQQRWDTIAALGNPIIKTPALDSLVRSGVAFTNAYTPSPVCVSARCALTAGLPPHRSGCVDNMPMPQSLPSIMEHLAAAGYQTHGVGKMHFTPELSRMWGFESRDISEKAPGHGNDFRRFLDENGYAHVDEPNGMRSEMYYIPQPSQLPAHLHHTAWVGERSRDFLARRDRARPFFLWTSFDKPHPPFEASTPWNKLYRAAEMAPPFRPEGFDDLLTYWNRVQNRYKYRDQGVDFLLLRTMRAMYYAGISFIDYHIGRILETLGDDAENTLVLFTSDHGELLGDYGSFGKRCMLDASVRVPLLARWPGHLAQGQQCAEPATLLDLFPTCLAAAGIDAPPVSAEGEDLVELAQGDVTDRTVFSQFQQGRWGLYMAVDSRWKYVYSAPDDREWLFDRAADPSESRNLAHNPMYGTPLAAMRTRLFTRFQRDGYTMPLADDGWRRYPTAVLPVEADAGLLFQDAGNLEARMAELGEYGRPVAVRGRAALEILVPKE